MPRRGIIAAAVILLLVAVGLWGWQAQQAGREEAIARALTGGDPRPAPALLIRYGCSGCHAIPGVPGADGRVGPALGALRQRVYIAGVLPNTAENLLAWLRDPRAHAPRTAMPVTGITEAEARDVAAYLYAH
jgi:cytochrome c2